MPCWEHNLLMAVARYGAFYLPYCQCSGSGHHASLILPVLLRKRQISFTLTLTLTLTGCGRHVLPQSAVDVILLKRA